MSSIDIKKAMESVSKLERLQAQIELRTNQYKEEEKTLKAQLVKHGIKEEDIEAEMERLSASIAERLTFIDNMDNIKFGKNDNGQFESVL